MKDVIRETLAFEDLTAEEKEKRHILGRLYGPVADVINPTRNGRKYSEELWENVFANPIMQEKFKNKVMYGELGHPEDRTEVDMEKIAVSMPEPPKKDKDGRLIAYLDILDTPNGRILKTLCDYGSTLGISSRGTGDLYTDDDGEEAVDPETYDCECFDIVLVPAVESARLQFTEGLNKTKTMKQALCESLEKASEEDRKVMEEALHNLNINVEEPKQDDSNHVVENIESESPKQTEDETKEANNDGSEELIKSLQEALGVKAELENRVKELQEQLAVSDTKVSKLEEDLTRSKSTIIRLTNIASNSRENAKKVSTLEEELKVKNQTIDKLTKENEDAKNSISEDSKLTESLNTKDATIKELNESLTSIQSEHEKEINALKESLEKKLTDSSNKIEELTEQVAKTNKLREGYKKLANDAVSKYIDLKAKNLGLDSDDIRNKLGAKYTLDDVDRICESLQNYTLNMSKLPFKVDRQVRLQVKETQETKKVDSDDYVDDTLMASAGLI